MGWCKYLKMAFCPRSAQKIFWWLKSTSKATVLRSCSTICVYSRLSSPSFRMSLRFVKIRQGSLPAMQEMALKVWSDCISIHMAYEHSSPTKVCFTCLPYEWVHVQQLDLANESALVINWLQTKATISSEEPWEHSWSISLLQHTTQSHLPTALHTPVLEFIW